MPTDRTCTSTSPGPGTGCGRSSTTRSPCARRTAARIATPSLIGPAAAGPSLSSGRLAGSAGEPGRGLDLDLAAHPCLELVQRLGVLLEVEAVTDHHVRSQKAGGEQLAGPLEAV